MARVVIVDDSLLIRTRLREIFSAGQHEVVGEAGDGLEAPGLIRELRPDLVTLDLVMPGRDGLTTLSHLLMIDPGLAVIVCSASLSQGKVIAALRLGASGFIPKPFNRKTVLDMAREVLGDNDRRGPCSPTLPRKLAPSPIDPAAGEIPPPDTSIVKVSTPDLHGICRALAGELREILEDAVDSRRVRLDQVLALDYQELKGSRIQRLQRLFDVSQVPAQGFDPPKFQTAYGSLLDTEMMERMDAVLAAEPRLTFALPFDLNVYAPAHNGVFSANCTGDPKRDLALNRTKRFFLDSAALTRAARMEIGVEFPPRKLSLSEIKRAGARLEETADGTDTLQLQTYTRDTGEVLSTLSVPLFVKGQRFGVVTLGWDPQRLHTKQV